MILGMGVGLATNANKKKVKNISHSAVSSIKGFDKIDAIDKQSKSDNLTSKNLDYLMDGITDDLIILGVNNTDSFFDIKTSNRISKDDDFWDSFNEDRIISNKKSLKPKILDTIEHLEPSGKHNRISTDRSFMNENTSFSSNRNEREINKFNSQDRYQSSSSTNRSSNNSRFNNRNESSNNIDLNKKFAGAKSISSSQVFGNDRDDYEDRNSINRFQGKLILKMYIR